MSERYIVLPVSGDPYILSDVIRDEKNNIDEHKTIKKVVNGFWERIRDPIQMNFLFTNNFSKWEKVADFLNNWKPTSDVRIYCNDNGKNTQACNHAIYMKNDQICGNICIVVTDGDFHKYDFSSFLNTSKFEENP